jgi:hypothetical protein
LAREAGQFVIPVGATGHAARTIWEKACADPSSWIPGVDVAAEIQQLGDESLNAGGLVDVVVQIIQKIRSIKS